MSRRRKPVPKWVKLTPVAYRSTGVSVRHRKDWNVRNVPPLPIQLLIMKAKTLRTKKKLSIKTFGDGILWEYAGKPEIWVRPDGLYGRVGISRRLLEHQAWTILDILRTKTPKKEKEVE